MLGTIAAHAIRRMSPFSRSILESQEDKTATRGVEMASRSLEIAPDVHWLPLHGTNVYFVRSGEDWILVDAGFPGAARAIAGAADLLCGPARRPMAILLTHGHPDHAGTAQALAAIWDVPVFAPQAELPYIDGTELYPEPLVFWLRRVLPAAAMAALTRRSDLGERVRTFEPGDGVPGLPDWRAVPTPGHTPGHTAYFRPGDGMLLAGDAVLAVPWSSRFGGRGPRWVWELVRGRRRLSGPPTMFTCDWRAAGASIGVLAELDPWSLATGHGRPLAGRHVAPLLRAFAAKTAATPLP
jgi:glyoxylase-like metal-dependent hydrolase (beta-lactamase superfamily II)